MSSVSPSPAPPAIPAALGARSFGVVPAAAAPKPAIPTRPNYQKSQPNIAANHLTAFIDVQGKLLLYVVAAWEDDFTGYIVDYGSFPDQKRSYFTLRDARHIFATEGTGLEGSLYAGMEKLTTDLLGRE